MRYVGIVALTVGCGPAMSLRVDPSFTADERQEIYAAADEWSHATDGVVSFTFSIGLERPVILRSSLAENKYSVCPRQEPCWAVVRRDDDVIYVDGDSIALQPGAMRGTVLHELGHWVGLSHICPLLDDECERRMAPSVMLTIPQYRTCVGQRDLDGLGVEGGRPCHP